MNAYEFELVWLATAYAQRGRLTMPLPREGDNLTYRWEHVARYWCPFVHGDFD